jgi:Family of unknown function (DUF6064)
MGHSEQEDSMPFTVEQFFDVFARYNLALWPWQIAAILAGIISVGLLMSQSRTATVAVLVIMAVMWLVNGMGYHWTFFAPINPAARLFAAGFVVEAVLLLAAAVFATDLRLTARGDLASILGLVLIVFALAVYPAIGWLAGHRWPAMPMFGVAPCPTTIFTIGLLLQGPWRTVRWLLILPGLWAAVGGSASVLLGVPQDYALVASLLLLLLVAFGHWRDWGVLRG